MCPEGGISRDWMTKLHIKQGIEIDELVYLIFLLDFPFPGIITTHKITIYQLSKYLGQSASRRQLETLYYFLAGQSLLAGRLPYIATNSALPE